MEIVVVKNSIRKYVLYALLASVFVAGGIFILFTAKDLRGKLIGTSCVVFFGFALLIFLRQIFDSRPRIVLDDNGVFDRTLDIGVIEWRDITNAYQISMMGNDFISLVLTDPEKYLRRTSKAKSKLARYNKTLGFETINLNLSGTDKSSDEIFNLVVKQVALNKIKSLETSGNR